ncbi:MAG: TetR/AcrR family transcriptional regulator [Spirochaetales bacterium]|nr:TetR/AcrR family transcriptional regulator [Spirochaetales bacterium]
MATAKFDRKDIVEKLKQLFWENGYHASSMQQVVEATGLKPGSLYNSFGNKDVLYRDALENYTNTHITLIKKTIDSAPTVLEGICLLLDDYINQSGSKTYRGCFLIKTLFEMKNQDKQDLYNIAASGIEKVEGVLRAYLTEEFGEELGRVRASSVMLHMNGIRVYSYRTNVIEKMRLGVIEGLPWLPWDKY